MTGSGTVYTVSNAPSLLHVDGLVITSFHCLGFTPSCRNFQNLAEVSVSFQIMYRIIHFRSP